MQIDDNYVPAVLDGRGVEPRFQLAVRDGPHKLVWGQVLPLLSAVLYTALYRPGCSTAPTAKRRARAGWRSAASPPYWRWPVLPGACTALYRAVQVYNLARDPGETRNLAPARPDLVLRLKSLALNYYHQLVPPRFLGLQTTSQVRVGTAGRLQVWQFTEEINWR